MDLFWIKHQVLRISGKAYYCMIELLVFVLKHEIFRKYKKQDFS
jgi:hypothetical protein